MSNHTPGPWYSDEFEGITIFHDVKDRRFPICKLEPISDGEAEANARLIAAAPEILEALKFSLAEWYQYDSANKRGGPMERARRQAIKMAEAAIAKAEGSK